LPEGSATGERVNTLQGRIEETVYLGEMAQYRMKTTAGSVTFYELNPRAVKVDGAGAVAVALEDVVVLKQ